MTRSQSSSYFRLGRIPADRRAWRERRPSSVAMTEVCRAVGGFSWLYRFASAPRSSDEIRPSPGDRKHFGNSSGARSGIESRELRRTSPRCSSPVAASPGGACNSPLPTLASERLPIPIARSAPKSKYCKRKFRECQPTLIVPACSGRKFRRRATRRSRSRSFCWALPFSMSLPLQCCSRGRPRSRAKIRSPSFAATNAIRDHVSCAWPSWEIRRNDDERNDCLMQGSRLCQRSHHIFC
jgi:hypothetical protein